MLAHEIWLVIYLGWYDNSYFSNGYAHLTPGTTHKLLLAPNANHYFLLNCTDELSAVCTGLFFLPGGGCFYCFGAPQVWKRKVGAPFLPWFIEEDMGGAVLIVAAALVLPLTPRPVCFRDMLS